MLADVSLTAGDDGREKSRMRLRERSMTLDTTDGAVDTSCVLIVEQGTDGCLCIVRSDLFGTISNAAGE